MAECRNSAGRPRNKNTGKEGVVLEMAVSRAARHKQRGERCERREERREQGCRGGASSAKADNCRLSAGCLVASTGALWAKRSCSFGTFVETKNGMRLLLFYWFFPLMMSIAMLVSITSKVPMPITMISKYVYMIFKA